jgi:hypothetical protein
MVHGAFFSIRLFFVFFLMLVVQLRGFTTHR